jgi:hypothetical protein
MKGFKRGKTTFEGVEFTDKKGNKDIVKPTKDVKKIVEDNLARKPCLMITSNNVLHSSSNLT